MWGIAGQRGLQIRESKRMKQYTLIARLEDMTRVIVYRAMDDSDAMLKAIDKIMDKAMSNPIWAKGYIALKDNVGDVVAEMGAK
jgi:hypothetical protein